MAEQQPSNALAVAFPSPPPFYHHFTPENLDRIATLQAAAQQQSWRANASPSTQPTGVGEAPVPSQALRVLDLPPELRFLQPPEPPEEGIYRSFGDVFNLHEGLPSLAEQGITLLYDTPTPSSPSGSSRNPAHATPAGRATILKRLAKSLLLNFLELMGVLSVNPSQYGEKMQDLRTLFINFHHLLNEYRPHQARESLILMMEEQLQRARSETAGMEAMRGKVEGILKGLGRAQLATGEEGGLEKEGEPNGIREDVDPAVAVWEELQREFG